MPQETYLRRRTMEALNTDHLDEDLVDLSLNMLTSAFAELVSSTGSENAPTVTIDALARHYANMLIAGRFVVFRDPTDNITYYVKAHGNDLVAVFHPLGPWYNRWMAIGTTESVLISLGITVPAFTDITLIDRVFGFQPDNIVKDVPTAAVTVDNRPFWRWHIGGSPTIPAGAAVELLQERNSEAPTLETVTPIAEPSTASATVELATPGVDPVVAVPQTAMGLAFAGAMNQPRGSERRDGDRRRGGTERREMTREQTGDPQDHRHLPPHAQVTEQVLDKVHADHARA